MIVDNVDLQELLTVRQLSHLCIWIECILLLELKTRWYTYK